MSVIKKWSTGSIGNPYPDHSDRGNTNTKGLSYDTTGSIIGPGIEAYIEEDEVLASSDNRPLKNLVENDVILDKNISDVASEVDHGIFKDRYNEFSLEILNEDYKADPEIPSSEFLTTPLRINSGSSIINGKVTRIGNQKVLYFLRDDDSLIFPDYENNEDIILIELKDDNYFGDYRVVYTTISEDLPSNFESFEIKIVNKSTIETGVSDRTTIFKVYRDWEDITPLKSDSKESSNEVVNFKNDINFGQNSDGYWLKAETDDQQEIPGTYVSNVKIKKDIEIKDKFLEQDKFTTNEDTGEKEYEIVTDGIFFNDIQWSISEQAFDPTADIQDIYVNEEDGIYFILRSNNFREIFYKSSVSLQLQPKGLRSSDNHESVNTGIKKIKDYIFVYGTNGFIRGFDTREDFQTAIVLDLSNFSTDQEITDIYEWNDQIWIAGENKVWHSNEKISTVSIPEPTVENPDPTQDYSVFFSSWTFTELDLNAVIQDESGDPIIKKITTLERTRGNIIIDTAINENIFNLAKNGSFESGVPGELPTNWNITDDLNPMNSTFSMTASTGNSNTDRWGNYKGIIQKYASATKATVYQDYLLEEESRNRIFNFSTFLKSTGAQSSTIGIAEYDEYDQIISFAEETWSIGTDEVNTWVRPELAFRITTDDTKYLRYYINCENNIPLQVDGAMLEEIDNTGIEITDITCAPDVAGSLASKYLLLNSPLTDYYIWMNVDVDGNNQGDSVDPKLIETNLGSGIPMYPELDGKVGVPVLINQNEVAIEVANKTADAINFLADFKAYRIQNTIKVQVNTDIPGQVVDAETATLGPEGFEINIAVQGLYQASQYVENYEYLFIGFEKQEYNRTDPPFAVIDITNPTGPQAIKYVYGKYGNIKRINTALHDDSNRMYVTDDKRVYSLTFLNNYNSYDRFTMVNIGQESNDLNVAPRMHKFETIAKFNNRIMFGGTVDNRVIKAEYALDAREHIIEFTKIEDGSEEFLDLMGDSVFIHANGTDKAQLEFTRTDHCYEHINPSGSTELGYYKASENYGFRVFVDGEEEAVIIIKSPDMNAGPWTLQEIYEQISIEYQGNKINWLDPQGKVSPVEELDWVTPQSSSVKTDGFYSIGRQDLTRHVRGNIHKIFIPEGQDEKFYIIRGKQIFQSKFDPNVLKDDNGNYPEELKTTGTVITEEKLPKSLTSDDYGQIWHVKDKAYYQWYGDHWEEIDYYTRWNIYDEVALTKYKHLDNVEKTFADSSINKVWVSLPIDPGYKLLKGSIRLKTNNVAEVGFTEGEDYFVDYDNNMIIRSDTTNLLLNPEFSFADSVINIQGYNHKGSLSTFTDLPIDLLIELNDVYYIEDERAYYKCVEKPASSRENAWEKFENDFVPLNWGSHLLSGDNVRFKRTKDVYDDRNDVGEIIMSSSNPGDEIGVIYQTKDVDFAQDTYTFSLDLKAYNYSKVILRISECDSSNVNLFGYDKVNGLFTDSAFTSSERIYEIGDAIDYDLRDDYDTWKTVDLSHELSDPRTTKLRVEIYTLKSNQLKIDKAQLEKNASATPFIEGSRSSRVDPNMHVWLDYIEYREMTPGVDYTFSQDDRKITIHEEVEDNEYFYFRYKYEKIFNPYDYGNSKPVTAVNYDARDDYFLLKPEGRIWAINQMFAMLSLETDDPLLVTYNYHYPRVDQIKIRNAPDRYGNFVYIVKGYPAHDNPYKPNDVGSGEGIRGSRQYFNGVEIDEIEDDVNNDVLYEINIVDNNYQINDLYDRRIYIDARDNLNYNISLLPETLAYFPFKKDFNSTNGLTPLNFLKNSKIIPIIKNYSVIQLEEVGAWHDGYQLGLRTQFAYPGTSFSLFVDPVDGSDDNDGKSENTAYKTVQKAVDNLYSNGTDDYVTNVVITRAANITENIEIDKPFTVSIVAKTYCNWVGSIQNITRLNLQGIWFKNTAIYPYNELNIYYCTFENASINCASPQKVNMFNSEAIDNHNSLVRVKNTLFPSPFTHPYMRISERDDGTPGYPESVATSDNESISPGDSFINAVLQSSTYIFQNCLIHGSTDHIVEFDPEPNWSANFGFDFCTIADNAGLFATPKYDLIVTFSNSILHNNRELVGNQSKVFNTNSSINFDTCFIDFPNYSDSDGDSANWNYKSGELLGRESCIFSGNVGGVPQFIGEEDYHLKSIAKGSTTDSPALEQGTGGLDLGCYAETREQTEQDIPKKLKNYTAYIDEALRYALTINSEKITVTMEFKPAGTVSNSGILFDTRTADDDLDYIVLAYNNNADDDHSLTPNPLNSPDDPYRFRVIVSNQEKSYSIISPINITTDEEYQTWHRLSFTINYEKIINAKPKFDEYNKLQNIIIFYHNDQASIESFVKYDLSRLTTGELIEGRGGEGTNAWDFNDITRYITIGAAFDDTLRMTGYYDELRIDNRFIDRKQFELWNVKKVQFNDPVSYVNEIPLTRSLDPRTLEEYWSLKSDHDIGTKKNKFLIGTEKRMTYEDGYDAWFVGNPTQNIIINSNFAGNHNSLVETDNISFDTPLVIENNWLINTVDSRVSTDNTGIELNILNPYLPQYSADYGRQDLGLSIADTSVSSSIGANTFPYRMDVNGVEDDYSLILTADPGYQEIDGGGSITATTSTGLNGGGVETIYGLEYTLQPSGDVKNQSIQLEGQKEITNVTVSGSIGNIQNKYFELSSTADAEKYYVWYAEEDGTSGLPTEDSYDPAGQLQEQELTITTSYSNQTDWDGMGFTIYKDNGDAFNLWFDVSYFSNDYIYSPSTPPDFGNSGNYDYISLTRYAVETTTQLAQSIKTKLLNQGFDVTGDDNVLNIKNTVRMPLEVIEFKNNANTIMNRNIVKLGSLPVNGLDAHDVNGNPVKTGIMVLIDGDDTQDDVLNKTATAFNDSSATDGVIDAVYESGNIEQTEVTITTNNKLDLDSKYFTLVSADESGVNNWYYTWFDAGQAGDNQVTEITCFADDTASLDDWLTLNDKYFVISLTDGTEHYFWYNTGDGRDPGEEHLAEEEIFTVTYEDTSEMRDKSGYAGKYFEFSTPLNQYYVWYTNEGVGTDPAIAGRQQLKVDLGQTITGADQRSQIIDATMNILRAQVVGFTADSVKKNDGGEGEHVMRMTIPAGDVVDPTIGSFDQSDMSIIIGQQGTTRKDQEYFGDGISHEIVITENESAIGVAGLTQTEINKISGVSSTVSDEIITITFDTLGPAQDPDFENIRHTAIVTTQGINPTTDPAVDGYVGIRVDITTFTTAEEFTAAMNLAIEASTGFTSTYDDVNTPTMITISTADDTEHMENPNIGTLSGSMILNVIYEGQFPQVKFSNEVNGIVSTPPKSGTIAADIEIVQAGFNADTTYGALINELNIECSGDLIWSIVGGKLRATTVAQGETATVEIVETVNADDLITALGSPTINTNQLGSTVDDSWNTIVQQLNAQTSGVDWEFIDNGGTWDIRAISKQYGAGSHVSFVDTTDPLDMITQFGGVHGSLPETYEGFSKTTIHNQFELESILKEAFKDLETRITWAFRNSKLVFFTDDIIASQITVDLGESYAEINSSQVINGYVESSSWNIEVDDSTAPEDTVSFNYLPEFNRFSENSMVVEKLSTDIPIYITQNIFLQQDIYYTFSALIHSDDYVTSDHLQFKLTNEEINWTSIERQGDNWWKVVYTFKNELPGNYVLGLAIKNVDRIYIDAVQLETKYFASPYVENVTNSVGKIGISKSLLNKERGTLFFKFKPYFKYDEPRENDPRVIINIPAIDDTKLVNQDLGLKVVYYFDPYKNRGIFEYKINNLDSSVWKLEMTEDFFNQWHSIGFVYDFLNNRFIYWLDYFNYIIDSPYTNYVWHDMWIGHDGVASKSADMSVKDIIIHNYTTTDSEIQNWNTAYEFFNESMINSSIEAMKQEIEGVKQDGLDYSDLSEDLENKINMLENRVGDYEVNEDNNADALSKIKEFVEYPIPFEEDFVNLPIGTGQHETRITDLESITNNLNIKTDNIQEELNDIINGGSEGITVTSNLVQFRSDIDALSAELNTERNTRAVEDQAIKDLYASTTVNQGASLIGVNDVNGRYSATNVEDILAEIAGDGRTVESIMSLKGDIINLESTTLSGIDDIEYIKDGNTGNWSQALAQSSRYNIYETRDDLETIASELYTMKDNNTQVNQSYQDIIVTINDINDNVALTPLVDYSIILNSDEYYFAVPTTVSWDSLITTYLPAAQKTTDGALLSDSYEVEITDQDNNLRITDIINSNDAFEIVVENGVTYSDFIVAISGVLDAPNAIGSNFDGGTMNNVTLSDRIDSEISDREAAFIAFRGELASTTTGQGASMIYVEDPSSIFINEDLEGILDEISGAGRNSAMTISGNYNTIQGLISDVTTLQNAGSSSASEISDINNDLGMMKDGIDGSTWDALGTKPNIMDHESRIDDAEGLIQSNQTAIASNAIQVSNLNSTTNTLSTDLATEISNRTNGDAYIMQQLADDTAGKGASLISIEDADGRYTATTVEGALAEVDTKIAALAGALSWQSPVNDYASLPTVDNSVGDARTVFDDGDGHQAQYVWDGTVWVKIADIDWGDASAIGYDNTLSEIPVTDVQAAIDYVYLNQKDKTKSEGVIASTDWVAGSGAYDGFYYANVNHELETEDIVCLVMADGFVIGVEEIERIDENNVRIYVVDNSLNLDITVFGVVDKYSRVISQWTPDGTGSYYADIPHGFETQKLMVSTFDLDTEVGVGWLTGTESIEFLDDNTIRVKTGDNTTVINLFVLKKATDTITKDIQNWVWDVDKDAYIAAIQVDASYDAVFNFFDPSSGKTVGMDLVQLENGVLTIAKSNNDIVRMIIIK